MLLFYNGLRSVCGTCYNVQQLHNNEGPRVMNQTHKQDELMHIIRNNVDTTSGWCKLTGAQLSERLGSNRPYVSNLLTRLVLEGKLNRATIGKNTHYHRPTVYRATPPPRKQSNVGV